jgi:hypothetical protein
VRLISQLAHEVSPLAGPKSGEQRSQVVAQGGTGMLSDHWRRQPQQYEYNSVITTAKEDLLLSTDMAFTAR